MAEEHKLSGAEIDSWRGEIRDFGQLMRARLRRLAESPPRPAAQDRGPASRPVSRPAPPPNSQPAPELESAAPVEQPAAEPTAKPAEKPAAESGKVNEPPEAEPTAGSDRLEQLKRDLARRLERAAGNRD